MLDSKTRDAVQRDYVYALVKASDDAADRLIDVGVKEADAYALLLEWNVSSLASLVQALGKNEEEMRAIRDQAIEHLSQLIDRKEAEVTA